MSGCTRFWIGFSLLVVVQLACTRSDSGGERLVFPTQTPQITQTPFLVEITTTPALTYTPVVKEVTSTPQPGYLCVTADENVYLRPSADLTGYPIAPLPNGSRLTDLGGRNGRFAFVSYGEFIGWVHLKFVINCK
jgi:hypothetical protein